MEFSITGRLVNILHGGDASIQTAIERASMPFELIEGDAEALRERDWHFYWMRSEVGEHSVEYRPGEQARQSRHARQSPEARARVSEIRRDLLKRRIKKLAGIDVSAGQERS
jgi:hypothetical protein